MFTTLNNQQIISSLQAGKKLYILEYFPPIDQNGTVYAPCDINGEPLVPILDAMNIGMVPNNVQRTRFQKPDYIYSFEEYENMFNVFYQSIVNMFSKDARNLNLKHAGLMKLYENYKYVTSTDTIAGLVNIAECEDYITVDARNSEYLSRIKAIPELNNYPVGYRTFCYSVKRMFPETYNSLTLAGSLLAYNTYRGLFEENTPTTDYRALDNLNFIQLNQKIDSMLANVDPNIIKESFKHMSDHPMLRQYMHEMLQAGFPTRVAIDLLGYHSSIKDVVLLEIRNKFKLPNNKLADFPIIFDVLSATNIDSNGFKSFL